MKPQYTPGPWIVGDASQCGQYVWDPTGERIVAEAYPDEHQDFEANAKLIAAAPELLSTLKTLSQTITALRAGKRDGGTMGQISLADDFAKALLTKLGES